MNDMMCYNNHMLVMISEWFMHMILIRKGEILFRIKPYVVRASCVFIANLGRSLVKRGSM
jgi:hypothetical protein